MGASAYILLGVTLMHLLNGGAQHMGAADLEADGLVGDALVGARQALSLGQDLAADAVKVVEALAGAVQELAPLRRAASRARGLLHLQRKPDMFRVLACMVKE